jgi:putative chitinase
MALNRAPIFDAFRRILGRGFTQAEVAAIDEAIDEAEGIAQNPRALTDAAAFFRVARDHFGPLSQSQVEGFETLLQAFGVARWPLAWAAYGLATAWHETAMTMQPVREAYWKTEAWRKANLRYWPWYGRGYPQLTWDYNYKKADDELGLNGALVADPDLAMRCDIAAKIMVRGMEQGWFTTKSLGDFLPRAGPAGLDAFKRARTIINGQDKALKIAREALVFQSALEAGGWA